MYRSEEELKLKKIGVLSTLFPKSWQSPGLIPEHSRENEPEHPLLERHHGMLNCPALVLLLYNAARRAPASQGDFLGIMSLGCVLENMWLMADSMGIGFHAVSALGDDTAEPQLKKLLNIPDVLRIAISFRLGYPIESPKYLRVRRDVSDFAHFNHYNKKSIV